MGYNGVEGEVRRCVFQNPAKKVDWGGGGEHER